MPTTFTFTVKSDGSFFFKPTGDWKYKSGAEIEFVSPSGEFVIAVIPASIGAPLSPFVSESTELRGSKVNGVFKTKSERVKPNDAGLLKANDDQFIARYRYAIAEDVGGKCHISVQKSGQWDHC